jgi:hypothetical protein
MTWIFSLFFQDLGIDARSSPDAASVHENVRDVDPESGKHLIDWS